MPKYTIYIFLAPSLQNCRSVHLQKQKYPLSHSSSPSFRILDQKSWSLKQSTAFFVSCNLFTTHLFSLSLFHRIILKDFYFDYSIPCRKMLFKSEPERNIASPYLRLSSPYFQCVWLLLLEQNFPLSSFWSLCVTFGQEIGKERRLRIRTFCNLRSFLSPSLNHSFYSMYLSSHPFDTWKHHQTGQRTDPYNLDHFRKLRSNRLQRLYDNSWLWKDINIGPLGYYIFKANVPNTPASWVVSAFGMSTTLGFGLQSSHIHFSSVRPFYMNVEMPENCMLGEQIGVRVTIFNNLPFEIEVVVVLARSLDYKFVHVGQYGQVSSYNPKTSFGEHHHLVLVCNTWKPPSFLETIFCKADSNKKCSFFVWYPADPTRKDVHCIHANRGSKAGWLERDHHCQDTGCQRCRDSIPSCWGIETLSFFPPSFIHCSTHLLQ